jgi:hypothetical protein
MKQNIKLIPFDGLNTKQIELKYTDTFKWSYAKKLIDLIPVNNDNYQIIMVKDINENNIDLYYCNNELLSYAISEINKYYFCFIQTNYINLELI